MIASTTPTSVLDFLRARTATGNNAASTVPSASTKTQAAAATKTTQAALDAAAAKPKATSVAQALDKRQATLGVDLRAAMAKAGVKLGGPVEFSVTSDNKVEVKGSAADKAATNAFLKAEKSQPSFASRIANQAKDALTLSNTLQQSAAISQAARYSSQSSNVMSLYNSLLSQTSKTPAVFSLGTTSSSLTYAGSLAAKA